MTGGMDWPDTFDVNVPIDDWPPVPDPFNRLDEGIR